ncbi:hypothetical protein RHGRI_023487 [Rhododendron griersonianum]|uniref:TF-B3 domain-containing protein n=1 Tax=Rhododendron griersonianum TaxID=479676 RepID=A0AAV6J888_9ERIC|nr:hypothetical protein RHGRI_023487 [Rhododendron griersonianum]
MVERREIPDFSESSPQFCKVYVPDLSSHRLFSLEKHGLSSLSNTTNALALCQFNSSFSPLSTITNLSFLHLHSLLKQQGIPPHFLKHFNGVFPYKSTITTPEKRSWHVELKEVDEHLYFQEGWQQFVHDNSLVFGDFLIFYYGGNAQFYTKIYAKNGCRKKVSGPAREIDKEITHPQDNQTVERRKSKRLAQGANGDESAQKELCPTFSSATQERTRKEASKFVSEFPFFEVVMRPSYIKGLMNIPSSFRNKYMEKDRQCATLVASDRSWPVKTDKTGQKFYHGWSTFCRENTLKVDDVCVFELIEKNDFVLKVTIFRCPV